MFDLNKAMASAASGMNAQSFRMRLLGENIANADTPGYHRKKIGFDAVVDRSSGSNLVQPTRVRLDQSPMRESYDPGHPLANDKGLVSYSNVDPLIEIADAREAQRSYQANLTIFDQARRMQSGLLDLLRR